MRSSARSSRAHSVLYGSTPQSMSNSVAPSATALAIGVGSLAGYAMSRWRFWGRAVYGNTLLVVQMFPGVMLAIPLYLLLTRYNLIDTLWALGQRFAAEGIETPFERLLQAWHYQGLEGALEHLARLGEEIRRRGLPTGRRPMVFGFTGLKKSRPALKAVEMGEQPSACAPLIFVGTSLIRPTDFISCRPFQILVSNDPDAMGITTWSGVRQPSCSTVSKASVLDPSA